MFIFYFLILIMPLSQHHLWGQFAGDLTGVKYIGLTCLPYALIHLGMRGSPPAFLATMQARCFLVLTFLATLSFVTAGNSMPLQMSHWLTYLSLLILFFIVLVVVDSLERVRWVLLFASASLALASLYVLRDWQTFHSMYRDYRPGWVVGDPNYFTVNVLLFIPTTLLMAQQPRPRWQRWFCLGCFIVTLFGVWVTASRGGFLGTVACALCLIWRSKQRVRNLALIAVGFVLVTAFSPNSPIQRFRHPTAGDDQSADTHVALMHAGIRMMLTHPLLGVGLDNFRKSVRDYVATDEMMKMDRVNRVAHNSYVEIGAEMGIPALLSFLGIIFFSLRTLGQVAQRAKSLGIPQLTQLAYGLQAGLLGSSVSIFFVSGEYEKMYWVSLFLTMCLPPLVEQAEREQRKARKRSLVSLSSSSREVLDPVGVLTAQVAGL
jgi:O-antigen ligase